MQSSLTSNCPTTQHSRRRGLSNAVMNSANPSPSPIAVASFYRRKVKEKGGAGHSSDLERVTLIVTCMNCVGVGGPTRNRRITLAAVVDDEPGRNGEQNYRVMGIQYATTNILVTTLCIHHLESRSQSETFDNQHHSILVALDTSGVLHTCPINNHNSFNDEDNHLREMRECHFEIANRTTTYGKRVKPIRSSTHESKQSDSNTPDLRMMNSLASRVESEPIIINTSSSSQIALHSKAENLPIKNSPHEVSPKKNTRKRKPSSTAGESVKSCDRTYLVASNLNTSILPSQSPPIVILLSSSISESSSEAGTVNSPPTVGLAWSRISGLEQVHVPLSCILFVSRSRCRAQMWASILSAMKKTADTDTTEICNDGVVLMGFQDGTLRASLVVTTEHMTKFKLDAGDATILFQLSSREPIKCIQILSSPPLATGTDTPILICVGALGATVSLSSFSQPNNPAHLPKFRIHEPLKLCGGCWISISCVKCYFLYAAEDSRNSDESIPSVGLAFVGVNDLKRTFLHQITILPDFSDEVNHDAAHHFDGQNVFRLPIPRRLASSVLASPQFVESKSPTTHFTFSLASSRGRVVMMKASLSGLTSVHHTMSRDCGGKKMFENRLIGPSNKQYSCASTMNHERNLRRPSNAQSLLQKLEAATAKENRVKTWQIIDSVSRQSKLALQEIREISRAAALISKTSFHNIASPIDFKAESINNGVAKCCIASYNNPLAKQHTVEWISSVHILQSCMHALSSFLRPVSLKDMPPICFRRSLRRHGKLIPVLYGGTSTSYNSCHGDEEIDGRIGRMLDIDVSITDFIPVHAYGSISMVYANSVPNVAKDQNDHTWYTSEVHGSLNGCKGYKSSTQYLELATSAGVSKNVNSTRQGRPGCAKLLGVSLPFNLNGQSSFMIDILSNFSTSSGERSGEHDKKVDGKAERLVIDRYQNRLSQKKSLNEYVVPWLKEKQFIWCRTAPTVDKYASAKFYCSSKLIHCRRTVREHNSLIFSNVNELCFNAGCSGRINMAIMCTQLNSESVTPNDNAVSVVEIAVGSNVMNPDECMSILPLLRQAIIRHGLGQHCQFQANMNSHDDSNMVDFYRKQLNENRSAKVTKHVQKIADELIADIDKTPELTCPSELLTATISLYEILRTIDIVFPMS